MKKHHHRIVPVALITVATPLGLIAMFLLVVNLFIHDEKTPNDSALRIHPIVVADDQNAYVTLTSLRTTYDSTADPSSPVTQVINGLVYGPTWDEAAATTYVADHQSDIQVFHAAAAQANYQDPLYTNPDGIDWNTTLSDYPIGNIRELAKVVAIDARQKAKGGKIIDGLLEDLEIVRLGHLMEQGNVSLIGYLVGSATKQIGLAGIRTITLEQSVSAADAKLIAEKLEAFRDSRDGQVTAMKLEYNWSRRMFTEVKTTSQLQDIYVVGFDASGQHIQNPNVVATTFDVLGFGHYYFLPNQTWRLAIAMTEQRVAKTAVACPDIDTNPVPFKAFRLNGPLRFLEPNAIGKFILEIGQVSYGGIVEKRCNESVAVSATQAILGINAARHATGTLPATLNELVPTYLKAVPTDPYANQSMKYLMDTNVVYSVGPKKVDVGGSPVSTDWQQLENPSFSVGK